MTSKGQTDDCNPKAWIGTSEDEQDPRRGARLCGALAQMLTRARSRIQGFVYPPFTAIRE